MPLQDTDPTAGAAERVGLPPRMFLYTHDQVQEIVQVFAAATWKRMLWFEGREVGVHPPEKIKTINVAPRGASPKWRIGEPELVRWMRYKGFRIYHRGWLRD